MVFSENIYFLILFTLPAAFNVVYNAYIRSVPRSIKDKSVELAECIVFCLAVFLANVLFMKKDISLFAQYMMIDKGEVQAFIEKNGFDYISFMIHYFILNIFTSSGMILIWNLIVKRLYRYLCNKVNGWINRPEEAYFGDVWRSLFETNELIDAYNHAIRIEKGGVLITIGLIAMHQAPNEEEKEFVVYNTERIKEIFEEDRNKKYEDKIFKDSKYEYYNLSNDVLIKFYSLEEYDKIN